jgi:hypothetical protein
VNSQFCTQAIPGVPNHGRHAMAVVDYSEGENGQGRRFLVQNPGVLIVHPTLTQLGSRAKYLLTV